MNYLHLIALISAFVCSTASASERFRYVMWLEPNSLEIVTESPSGRSAGIIVGGHAKYETRFCEEFSPYFCFVSSDFAFSVPKKGSVSGSWMVEGLEFSVLKDDQQLRLLGHEVSDVVVIRCPAGSVFPEKHHLALYSPKRGLLAIASDDFRFVYWLAGQTGFAARE